MQSLSPLTISAALMMLMLQGCSGDDDGPRESVYPVTGKITLSGAPIANANVTFSPKSQQPVAMGRTDSNGQYQLTTYEANDGAAVGDYIVLVSKEAPSAVAAGPPAHGVTAAATPVQASHAKGKKGESISTSSSIISPKYGDRGRSDLKATVSTDAEKNKCDFDLQP